MPKQSAQCHDYRCRIILRSAVRGFAIDEGSKNTKNSEANPIRALRLYAGTHIEINGGSTALH
jgi:hypothetical protein